MPDSYLSRFQDDISECSMYGTTYRVSLKEVAQKGEKNANDF
jgi:hypothetical protein